MNLDLRPIQEIEQELVSMCSPDFRAFAPEPAYRAARLFARINSEFEAPQRNVKTLGFWTFDEWVSKFRQTPGSFSRRSIFKYVKVGRYLIPQISEEQFKELGIEKAEILAAVAKAERLTADFLKASFDYSKQELEQRAAPLLGREASWKEHLRKIDSHEAAEAALLLLGNRLDFETCTADRGKQFRGQELGEIATLREVPRFATEQIMKSVTRVDVIWLKDDYPEYFFEVENTTDVTSGLHRMFQAVRYCGNLFIVGPEDTRRRFLREIEKSPFRADKQKYRFRSYNQLSEMFRVAMKYCDAHAEFFDEQG